MQLQTTNTGIFTPGFIPQDRRLVDSLTKLLEAHFKQNHEPLFYSGHLSISLKRLNRITDYYYKKTVYQLLQDRLHKEAEWLLRQTMMSAKEIAFELGVCDPAHFSRSFKKNTGFSPLEYRKRVTGAY